MGEEKGSIRESFGSKMGFVLAAAGSAVGLANLWRFPWLVGTYGGATFIVVYLIILAFLGYPLLLNEVMIGRKAQRNIVGAYKILAPNTPLFYLGLVAVLGMIVILSYYSAVAGWTLAYTAKTALGTFNNLSSEEIGTSFKAFISNPQEVFIWQFLFLILTALVVNKGVEKGIEKSSKILMPFLFVLLVILAIRSLTLDGAMEGVRFYLMPDISKISLDMIIAALGQAFFSLSVGIGAMLIYGSYLKRDVDLPSSTAMVAIFDLLVAFIGGLVIIPAVFAFGLNPGEGPGLTFVTLPNVFNQMPLGMFFGTLFFLLLAFAAFTTTINMMETFVAYFKDEWGLSRQKAVWIIGVVITFIIGIPSVLSFGPWSEFTIFGLIFFDFADYVVSNIIMPIGAIMLAVLSGWIWGTKNALDELNDGAVSFKIGYWWAFIIKYLAPILVLVILISKTPLYEIIVNLFTK